MRLNIGVKSSPQKAESVTAERLVNFYAEQTDGVSSVVVHASPGLELFGTAGTGIRGMVLHGNTLFVVSGEALYRVDAGGNPTNIGTIAGSGFVGMASSRNEIIITTGAPCAWIDTYFLFNPGIIKGYRYAGGTVAEIADGDFNTIANSNQWFISNAGDGSAYDALDFASAESDPDAILRVFVDHREVLLMGEKTVETWVNTGATDFPFEIVDGAITEKGLASRWAVDQIDNTVFWLDQDGICRRMSDGYSPMRISTHEVEQAMAQGEISQAEAFGFVWEGHEFWTMTVPGAGTFIYDAATQLWHERESLNEGRWRACCHAFVYGKHIVGDYENGNLYFLSNVTTENGLPMVSEMVFPPLNNDGGRFRLHEVELDVEAGVGTDYTDDPTMMLRLSNDGANWRSQNSRSAGAVGDRTYRTEWRRLGQHRNLHMKFSTSDPAERAVYNAYANITPDG